MILRSFFGTKSEAISDAVSPKKQKRLVEDDEDNEKGTQVSKWKENTEKPGESSKNVSAGNHELLSAELKKEVSKLSHEPYFAINF